MVSSGPFAGMPRAQLESALAQAQAALIALQTGNKPQRISYSRADGSQSVDMTPTSLAQVNALIAQLQVALGLRARARRAFGIRYL